MKTYLCWYDDDVESSGIMITKTRPEYSAEQYVKDNEDGDSIEYSIDVGYNVNVRCPDGEVMRFKVFGEKTVDYFARKLKTSQ